MMDNFARQLIKNRTDALMRIAHSGERTLVMGILNITPDSFSDGGMYLKIDDALIHAEQMIQEGADILDIGGESTRPGAVPLPLDEELRRIIPVVEAVVSALGCVVSVDTYKAEVARQAIEAGASIINDVGAMKFDTAMPSVAVQYDVPVCLMHMQGTPPTMQDHPVYDDVVSDVKSWLTERARAAVTAGIRNENIVLDPGFGFGKTLKQNLELLRRFSELKTCGYPLVAGTSRKGMIGRILSDAPPLDRIEGTAATVALAIAGGASVIRVHDVKEMARVARMTDAVVRHNTVSSQ